MKQSFNYWIVKFYHPEQKWEEWMNDLYPVYIPNKNYWTLIQNFRKDGVKI